MVACIRAFLPGAEVERQHDYRLVTYRSRRSRIQAFPISIDFEQFAQGAAGPEVGRRAFEIRRQLNGVRIAIGVDRLDYTKGIPERLRAFARLLRDIPPLAAAFALSGLVPSREDIVGYPRLMHEIEQLVAQSTASTASPAGCPSTTSIAPCRARSCWRSIARRTSPSSRR